MNLQYLINGWYGTTCFWIGLLFWIIALLGLCFVYWRRTQICWRVRVVWSNCDHPLANTPKISHTSPMSYLEAIQYMEAIKDFQGVERSLLLKPGQVPMIRD